MAKGGEGGRGATGVDACKKKRKKAKVIIVAACGSNKASCSCGLHRSASMDLLHKACLICASGEPDLPLMRVSFLS